jgi:type IV secretory pathway TraG/TraD family ATPase VirD4
VVEKHRSWSSSGRSISEQKTRRALITPGEVLELPTSKALIFKRGVKPILADQFMYYRDAQFRQWSELKPPAKSDQIRHGPPYEAGVPIAIRDTSAPTDNEAESPATELPPAHWRINETD